MAATAAPYGLKCIGTIGGGKPPSYRAVKIASGYSTNIFNGSIVAIAADGTLQIVTTNGDNSTPFPAGTIGVFVGCCYTDASLGYVTRQYWPSGTVASDAIGLVIDDDRALFMAQADGSITQTDLGQNTHLAAVQSTSTGSTATGNSTTALTATTGTTAAWAFRIVDFVDGPLSEVGDAYTDVIVKFNPGSHSYSNQTGI